MSFIGDLKLCLLQLNDHLHELSHLLTNHSPEFILMTDLAVFSKEEEKNGVDEIQVNNQSGSDKELVNKLVCSLGDFYAPKGEEASTKVTCKFPGVVVMPSGSFNEINHLIEQINVTKNVFEKIYSDASREHRFNELHEAFPRIVTLQVTRNIQVIHESVIRMRFYWHNNVITMKTTKQDVLNKLYKKQQLLDENIFLSLDEKMLQHAEFANYIATVNELPSKAELRYKRTPLLPTPALNIRTQYNGELQTLNYKVSLPIFIFNQPEQIIPLPDYTAGELRGNRAGKSKFETVIHNIGLEIKKQ